MDKISLLFYNIFSYLLYDLRVETFTVDENTNIIKYMDQRGKCILTYFLEINYEVRFGYIDIVKSSFMQTYPAKCVEKLDFIIEIFAFVNVL